MIAIGVDPGLHSTAWAVVSAKEPKELDGPVRRQSGLSLLDVGLWNGAAGLNGEEACMDMVHAIDPWHCDTYRGVGPIVVESQQVYEGAKRKGKPEDLIRLATISGAALRALRRSDCVPTYLNPVPREWKGNLEKSVPQARACVMLGWKFRLAGGRDPSKQWVVPTDDLGFSDRNFRDADWKNLMDAIALAIWGLRQ